MRRATELAEKMDDPQVSPEQLALSLRYIRRVNRFLGGTRAVLRHFQKFSRAWNPQTAVSILDVATGSADIPRAVLTWAKQSRFKVQLLALDLHPKTLALAQTWADPAGISFIRGNALALPFPDASVDYVTCSMFLHHLSEPDALAAIREMLRVARRGVIINDLLRSRAAYLGIWLLTLAAAEIDQHDARVSVRKAWTPAEARRWPGELGAPFLKFRHHLFARFTLAGEKP